MKIRIKQAPPGFAPQWVRNAWVGCVFDSAGKEDPAKVSSRKRAGLSNVGGYVVSSVHAFDVLKKHNDVAWTWWDKNTNLRAMEELVFRADVCEEVVGG